MPNANVRKPSPVIPQVVGKALPTLDPVNHVCRSTEDLHPELAFALKAILSQLTLENIPVEIYESWRAPARQNYLYTIGRSKGGIVQTRNQAWASLHQYGMAVDLGVRVRGDWDWNTYENSHMWARAHRLAEEFGLEHDYSWHFQMSGYELGDLKRAQFPPAGNKGQAWWMKLSEYAGQWNAHGFTPVAPLIPA